MPYLSGEPRGGRFKDQKELKGHNARGSIHFMPCGGSNIHNLADSFCIMLFVEDTYLY